MSEARKKWRENNRRERDGGNEEGRKEKGRERDGGKNISGREIAGTKKGKEKTVISLLAAMTCTHRYATAWAHNGVFVAHGNEKGFSLRLPTKSDLFSSAPGTK